ncbi:MAG: hypothetical protein ACXVFO_18845 [Solirubrobacteraceae bacterium]
MALATVGAIVTIRTTSAVALLCAASVATPKAVAAPPPVAPIGVHSMLYLDHPFGAKEAMF